jgi:hypothetical protein
VDVRNVGSSDEVGKCSNVHSKAPLVGLARGRWCEFVAPNLGTGVVPALRRVDHRTRLVETTIPVGDRPLAVAVSAGAVWVASTEAVEGMIYRTDPARNRVVGTISVGAIPRAHESHSEKRADEVGICSRRRESGSDDLRDSLRVPASATPLLGPPPSRSGWREPAWTLSRGMGAAEG